MTVIVAENHPMYKNLIDKKCTLCQSKLSIPFLEWNFNSICGNCCKEIQGKAFMRDLIQIVAIKNLYEIGYIHETLIYEDRKKINTKLEEELANEPPPR